MKPKKHSLYFWLTILGTLLIVIPDPGQSDHIGSDISDDMLAQLSNDLEPFECWITISYLAQRSSNPKAAEEISRIGGHSKKFNCYDALTYWKEEVLPLSVGANEIKVDGYELRTLAKAIAFAGRKDLRDWILLKILNTKKRHPKSDQWTYRHREIYIEAPPEKADDLKTEAVEVVPTSEKSAKLVRPRKKKVDPRNQQFATALTYVVAFTFGFIIISFAITTLLVCICPERFRIRFRRQQNLIVDEVEADEYEYMDDGRGLKSQSDGMKMDVKVSIVKELSEPDAKAKLAEPQIVEEQETESFASGENAAEVESADQNANVQKTPEDPEDKNNEN